MARLLTDVQLDDAYWAAEKQRAFAETARADRQYRVFCRAYIGAELRARARSRDRRRDRRLGCGGRPRARTSSHSRAGPGSDDPDEPDLDHSGCHPRSTRGRWPMAAERKDPSRRRPLEPRYEQRRWAQERYEALERLRRELDEREARGRPLFDADRRRAA